MVSTFSSLVLTYYYQLSLTETEISKIICSLGYQNFIRNTAASKETEKLSERSYIHQTSLFSYHP